VRDVAQSTSVDVASRPILFTVCIAQLVRAVLLRILSVVHFVPEWLDRVMLLNQDFMLSWVIAHHKSRNTIQLVQLFMCRSFYLRHNFVAAIINLMHHNLMLQIQMTLLWTKLLPKTKGKIDACEFIISGLLVVPLWWV
jgi:hypothetical protein